MRKIGFLVLCVTGLCAFDPAAPYDSSALPDAAAARQHLLNQCQAKSATFKTVRASVDCSLAAHKAYALAEKLRDMSLFSALCRESPERIAGDSRCGPADCRTTAEMKSVRRRAPQYECCKRSRRLSGRRAAGRNAGPAFDRAALPGAASRRTIAAVKNCEPLDRAAKSCRRGLPASWRRSKNFTAAIELQDMDLFYGYASIPAGRCRRYAGRQARNRARWRGARKRLILERFFAASRDRVKARSGPVPA